MEKNTIITVKNLYAMQWLKYGCVLSGNSHV